MWRSWSVTAVNSSYPKKLSSNSAGFRLFRVCAPFFGRSDRYGSLQGFLRKDMTRPWTLRIHRLPISQVYQRNTHTMGPPTLDLRGHLKSTTPIQVTMHPSSIHFPQSIAASLLWQCGTGMERSLGSQCQKVRLFWSPKLIAMSTACCEEICSGIFWLLCSHDFAWEEDSRVEHVGNSFQGPGGQQKTERL